MKAGWAQIEITPPLGLPMGGRGPRFTPGATALDPLLAQAVILEDDTGRRTLWISVDLVGALEQLTDGLRKEISQRFEIPRGAIVINFSHTHSGPMTTDELLIAPSPNKMRCELTKPNGAVGFCKLSPTH